MKRGGDHFVSNYFLTILCVIAGLMIIGTSQAAIPLIRTPADIARAVIPDPGPMEAQEDRDILVVQQLRINPPRNQPTNHLRAARVALSIRRNRSGR